jgi:cell division protein FtsB
MEEVMTRAPDARERELAELRQSIENLKAQNEALRERTLLDRQVGRAILAEDYFHAYKLLKEGRIQDALFEMERKLDDTVSFWRSWI